MKAAELRDYSVEDLRRRVEEQKQKLFQQASTSGETRAIRKEIARILTILRERELTEEKASDE